MDDTLPHIEIELFNERVEELRKSNTLVDRLIKDLGSWEKLPDHLKENLFKLVEGRPIIMKY